MYSKSLTNILSVVKSQLIYVGMPLNLSKIYNLGFILGVCLVFQIASGLILAMIFMRGRDARFFELFKILEYTGRGMILRYIHINVVSFFFIYLFTHVGRGLYYSSFLNARVWNRGVTILLLVMGTAFVGYVLPNNQMSYWGASVITSLVREVPYLGLDLVEVIWGRFRVCKFTLVRFFTLHFILPFVILVLVVLHIIFLHREGSRNPLGVIREEKVMFSENQIISDFFILALFVFILFYILVNKRDLFGDDQNFFLSNLIETPSHIQPEWYFLFAYAILRSIPNKFGGVVGLLMSLLILYLLSIFNFRSLKSFIFKPINKILFWVFVFNLILLSWIGMCRVEHPFVLIGQVFSVIYFLYFIVYFILLLVT